MGNTFTIGELKKIYQILKAFQEDVIANPSEEWELDYYDKPAVDKNGLGLVLKKIEKLLPAQEIEGLRKEILRRKYDTFNNPVDEEVHEKIEKAFAERRTTEIGYFNMDSAEITKRKIDIYHKTSKYVIAYCHLRQAMRKFRASRIVSAKATGKKYSIPPDFDKNNIN